MKRLVETCDDKGEMWLLLSKYQDKKHKLECTACYRHTQMWSCLSISVKTNKANLWLLMAL